MVSRHLPRLGDVLSRLVLSLLLILVASNASAQLIINEFRLRGPNGANDEFVEIYNNSGADHTVAGGGTGYALVASDGTARCVVPNGTVIPSRGHYLCVNSVGFSLASYPAGDGTTATGDATYTTDIPDNDGIALFNTSVAVDFTLANRLDAVGSTSEANTLYKEGTGYPALTPFSIDYSFFRDECGNAGSITTLTPCSNPFSKDTNNNAADFVFVDTNGTSAGAGQRLGGPGPENLSGPIFDDSTITTDLLDACVGNNAPPNVVRDFTSDPANNSTFGTLDVRHTFTNNTGAPLTRLRFRIVDVTTFPAPSGVADLRPRTSSDVVVTVDRAPCGGGTSNVTVHGTALEQPPSQPNGGGYNSSLSVGFVNAGNPLADGASIDVRFLIGVQQNGVFKLQFISEALPEGGAASEIVDGCTDVGGCPEVLSINRANADPTNLNSVDYTVTFNQAVNGVDTSDFALVTAGVSGASITGVAGGPTVYTVTVNTGTGNGTIRLDLVDDDSILDDANNTRPLGGPGVVGNGDDDGSFQGQVYTVNKDPVVVSVTRADPNPALTGTNVDFTVTFSEAVTGVDTSDFHLTTTGVSGASITGVAGGPSVYTVTVNTGTGDGTIRLDVDDDDSIIDADTNPLGGAGVGNGTFATGEVYTVLDPPEVLSITPTGPEPATGAFVEFVVTFSEPVSGVDPSDFTVGGTVQGAVVAGVSGGPTIFTVTVSTGLGNGTIQLNLVDDDSIVDANDNPLGGTGAANGSASSRIFQVATVIIPTLDSRMLALLTALLFAAAIFVMRRS